MKNKKGFTLVELLAVIVLLGILIGIAVPSVLGVSNKIKKNMYDTKLKNVKVALENWADDNRSNCRSLIGGLNVENLISENYLKPDDSSNTIKDNEGNSINSQKLGDLKYTDGNPVFGDLTSICPETTYLAGNYGVDSELVTRTQQSIRDWINDNHLNSSVFESMERDTSSVCSRDGHGGYTIDCLAKHSDVTKSEFSGLLEDGTTAEDYRVKKDYSGNFTITRYRYEVTIHLLKENREYDVKKYHIDSDNGESSIDVVVPEGYEYSSSSTCNYYLMFDDDERTQFLINESVSYEKNVDCNINFVPKTYEYNIWVEGNGTLGESKNSQGWYVIKVKTGEDYYMDANPESGYKLASASCGSSSGTSAKVEIFPDDNPPSIKISNPKFSSDCVVTFEPK